VVSLIKRRVLVNDRWEEGAIIAQLDDSIPTGDREVYDNGFSLQNRDAPAMKAGENSLGIIGFEMITREALVDRIKTVRDG
jgi:hypothetical protein